MAIVRCAWEKFITKTTVRGHAGTRSARRLCVGGLYLPKVGSLQNRFGKDAKDSLAWAALDIEVGGMPDEKIATWGIEKLNREYDRPFFLALGFYKPHVPMTAPKRYFDQFDRDKLTLPKVLENDLDDVPEIGRSNNTARLTVASLCTPTMHVLL